MSGRLVLDVLRYAPEDLSDAQLLVLVALAESARDTGPDARISKTNTTEIARLVRRSPGTVRNVIVELTRRCLIAPQGKAHRGHAQDYRIHPLGEHHRRSINREDPHDGQEPLL